MEKNIGRLDRIFRLLIGILFVAWAIAGGPFWSWVGLFFMATGAWGFSPLYAFFKISTRRG